MKEIFEDLLAHTHGLGCIEMVKIVGDDQQTRIEAISPSRSVVMTGTLKQTNPLLEGVTGLARMAVLHGYLRFPAFQDSNSTVNVVREARGDNNEISAVRLEFSAPGGHHSVYRFMGGETAESQIKVPPFKGVTWDVTLEPSDGNVKDLSYFGNILGAYDPTFVPVTQNNKLTFKVGSSNGDQSQVPFAHNVSGALTGRWCWPLSETLSILKLGISAQQCTMSFSEQGALQITVETELTTYQYILPARPL